MSGDGTVIVVPPDDSGAEFAAGHAAATAEQAAETAEVAEAKADHAVELAELAVELAVDTEEDDVTKEELEAFQAETRGTLSAILDRLDTRDVDQADEPPAGPPAPAPKDDVDQVATPEKDDVDQDEKPPADSPVLTSKSKNRKGYGARAWFGGDDDE